MTPSAINPRVLDFLHGELLTHKSELDRIAKYGILLVRSSDFLEQVAMHFGAEAVYVLNEFYRNFLGKYDLVCVSRAPYQIRYCNQIMDGGQDGVQLEFHSNGCRLIRLTAAFGATTFTLMKEYKY